MEERAKWVAPVLDAAKPPPKRVTLTLPVINHARQVVFIASGTAKAGIVRRALHPAPEDPIIPAQ